MLDEGLLPHEEVRTRHSPDTRARFQPCTYELQTWVHIELLDRLYRRLAVRNSGDTSGVIDALVLIRFCYDSIFQ
jgi:hypothetical protein